MRKASEYRQHASECRQLAMNMESGDQRDALLAMAAHWDQLARDRIALMSHHPELASDDEPVGEERPFADKPGPDSRA